MLSHNESKVRHSSLYSDDSNYIYQGEVLHSELKFKIDQIASELRKSIFYKWKNSKSEWLVTDQPPRKGIQYTTISSQDQINVISSPSERK